MFESTIISGQVYLGKQGEHCARRFSFHDVDIWREKFGEGRCELLHQRNGEEAPYPVVLSVENGVPYWCVSEVDTAIAGLGKCEVRYIVDDAVVKSNIYTTFVQESLGEGAEEPPEPAKAWVEQVYEAAEKTQEGTKDFTREYAYSRDEVNNIIAGALKVSASGETLYIDDISPLTHELRVKLSSESVTDFSKVRLRAFRTKGKNLFDVSKVISTAPKEDPENWEIYNNGDGSLTINKYGVIPIDRSQGTLDYVTLRELCPLLEVGKAYCMSAVTDGLKCITLGRENEDGTWSQPYSWWFNTQGLSGSKGGINLAITEDMLDCVVGFYNGRNDGILSVTMRNIQVEEMPSEYIGKSWYSPTSYEPYCNDYTEYTPNTDGTVTGVKSVHPSMYIDTDTADINIDVIYGRDTNEAIYDIHKDMKRIENKIPLKLSELQNDTNFVTVGALNNKADIIVIDSNRDKLIRLNDSSKGKIISGSIYGETSQANGAPTPNSPIEIISLKNPIIRIGTSENSPEQFVTIPYTLRGLKKADGTWSRRDRVVIENGKVKLIQEVAEWNSFGSNVSVRKHWTYDDVYYMPSILATDWYQYSAYCNVFTRAGSLSASLKLNHFTFGDATGTVYVKISIEQFPTASDFKTYLINNKVVFCYGLNSPKVTDITSEVPELLELYTYYPATTISCDGDIQIKYKADTTNAYYNLKQAIINLGGMI